jgi:exosome complex component RRP43
MATAALSAPGQALEQEQQLEADAFKKLYPHDYLESFLKDGIRPGGRVLGRARATTIGLGTITSIDGSALVKQGDTTVGACGARRPSCGRP